MHFYWWLWWDYPQCVTKDKGGGVLWGEGSPKVNPAHGKALYITENSVCQNSLFIYFSVVGKAPKEILTGDIPPLGTTVSFLLPQPFSSLYIFYLKILTEQQPFSVWEGGVEGVALISHSIFACITVELYSSHTWVVHRVLFGFAQL